MQCTCHCHPPQIRMFTFNDECACVWMFVWGYIILAYIFLAYPCISITEWKLQGLNPSQCSENRTLCPIGLCLCLPRHAKPYTTWNIRSARLCSGPRAERCRHVEGHGNSRLWIFTILSISGCNSNGAESASQPLQCSARRLAPRCLTWLKAGWDGQ